MELLGWFKRVKPVGKRLLRIYANPETELVELVKKSSNATWTKCELDSTNLYNILHILSTLLATGKPEMAANFCRSIAEKCFDDNPENPYRLMFLSFAMVADCETKLYELNFHPLTSQGLSLKRRYSFCQQASAGFADWEPSIFKITDLLTISEEFAHFSCFRQCHVNLLKHLAELKEDDSVDWFDIVKVIDSNILALINDSDVGARLCDTDKEKREFQQNLYKIEASALLTNDQYCYSWFDHLHLREICVRSRAAIEILKSDQAFKTFEKRQMARDAKNELARKHRRRLQPRNPELDEKPKRVSFGEDSGVLADANMVILRKNSNTLRRRKKNIAEKLYVTDTSDLNYCASLFDDCKSFSDWNEDVLEEKSAKRKEKEKRFNIGGPSDCRKRLPDGVRKKIRLILRKMMSEGREIQAMTVVDDDYLNRAFPVTDDECSDEEIAPHPFRRTETLETVRRRRLKKFGSLNPESDAKHVLWWENARDELLTIRAIENHCVKVTGESSEPFGKFEEYMGKPENGEKVRDRMMESRRVPKTRPFDIKRESDLDDGQLLTVPASDPFKDCRVKRTPQTIGLNSLLLQNMRRKCIDEFLLLLMIIKGQQMLQDGNVIRCLAYIMLIEYKLAVFHENAEFSPIQNNNFYPYLTQLHKKLLSKFRLYSTDIFGLSCTTPAEESTLLDEETEDFNALCEIFVQETRAYFFCICLRGKAVEHKPGTPSMKELDRTEIEQQHEFFFGLDQINKNNHLYSFWRTECMPIVTGLLCMIDHTLVDRIDSMDSARAAKHIDDFPGLSPSTREWVKQVTRYGYTKQKTRTEPKYNGPLIQSVPMLFQLPSRNNDENRADYMMEPEDLERVHEATTDFVREKHNSWRRDCRIDKENVGKTNRDLGYNEQQDLMFFGEAIEKDVYMVAAYRGEHFSEEGEEIAEKLHLLCRKMRSQAGFIITKTCHDAEDKSD